MERYGDTGIRVAGMAKALEERWSKRQDEMKTAAKGLGFSLGTDTARHAAIQRTTRAPKSTDDSQVRELRWTGESTDIDRDTLLAAIFYELDSQAELTPESHRELTAALDQLPQKLTRMEAVFNFTHLIAAVSHTTATQLDQYALDTAISRVLHNSNIVQLPTKRTRDAAAGMAHTRVYSTHDTLEMEQALTDTAAHMAGDTTHAIPNEAVETKIATLLHQGYELSDEQISAIHHATSHGAQLAIIEGAAGAGKTTTLRPIVDLHRERGYIVIGAANAWITANALGTDCDIQPFAIAKLLSSLAKRHLTLDERTLLVIDEAGMLSTRELHNILRITEQYGTKVILAGDTEQQQPIEAGPGLRLARDGADSVRVDKIRRQLPDIEDVLVHIHGETPETARLRASSSTPDERARVLADYEASPAKPVFTPWQVAASEAFRDGNAAEAIAAYHARGRVHLCRRTEATLNQLADDWARYRFENPNKTAVALARTNLERQALSERMRQHHLPGTALGQTVTVRVSEGPHGKRTTPLDIAPGEHLRIGATLWDKQLYNGDIVIVQSLETHPHPGTHEDRLLITGHTLDGRAVTFYHDEIHDWHGNIRLSHGYALTFASAQGITVDHAFVLADEKPARETIYPAATRHREGMDLYINRLPLTFGIAAARPEDQAHEPVTDLDVHDYLARWWSRSHPKEAASDYLSRPAEQSTEHSAQLAASAGAPSTPPLPAIALDNTISRIGRELRERALAYHHGPQITRLAAERADVLERVEALRDRARSGETRVALTPEYNQARTDLAGLLERAAPYRDQPWKFNRLLATAAGITQQDLAALEQLQARTSHHHRVVSLDAARESRLHPAPLSPEQLYRDAVPLTADDPAGRYLIACRFKPEKLNNFRFHPAAPALVDGQTVELPALVVPVMLPDKTIKAVHCYYLNADATLAAIENPQQTIGSPGTGAIWPYPTATAQRVILCTTLDDALLIPYVIGPDRQAALTITTVISPEHARTITLPPNTREVLLVQPKGPAGDIAWDALRRRCETLDPTLSITRWTTGQSRLRDILNAHGPAPLTASIAAPLWRDTHDQLVKDWNQHHQSAESLNLPATHVAGYDTLLPRLHQMADTLRRYDGPEATLCIGRVDNIIARQDRRLENWRREHDDIQHDWHIGTTQPDATQMPFIGDVQYLVLGRRAKELANELEGAHHPNAAALHSSLQPIIDHHQAYIAARERITHFVQDAETMHRIRPQASEQHDTTITHPTDHPRYPKWRLTTEKLLAAGDAVLNSTDPAYLAYFKIYPSTTTLLERRLDDLKTRLEQDNQYRAAIEQQDKTLTPEAEQKTTTRLRPDLSKDIDIDTDFHM